MRIKINDKIYRLKEIESGVDSLMELVEEPRYRDGDFLKSTTGSLFIHNGKYEYDNVCAHFYISGLNQRHKYDYKVCFEYNIAGFCSPEEVDMIHNELEKDGKRWNSDKKCVEDIPKRKFKAGDKVRIKDGISSETHMYESPSFIPFMDELIGKELTVKGRSPSGHIQVLEATCIFAEDWLEPWSEEPKRGDLCIFWDLSLDYPHIQFYKTKVKDARTWHIDSNGTWWRNAIKFDGTREQYDKIREGEL